MEVYILDTSFQLVKIIDGYESFIWTERYSDYGDFELYLPVDSDVLQYLKVDYYVEIRESDRTMIIEDIQIDTDVDNGPSLKISGRSLESILDRRIIWKQTLISNKRADEVIKQLLEENIMSSAGDGRCIDIFTYAELPDDHIIKTSDNYKISQIQFTGDNLFDVVKSICDVFHLGFRILLKNEKLQFELFVGTNRSYENDDGTEQLMNQHVVFSPTFDNLLNSSYLESNKTLKTITLVAGAGEGADRITVEVSAIKYALLTEEPGDWSTNYMNYYIKSGDTYETVPKSWFDPPEWKTNTYYITVGGAGNGLSRRELYTDARDLTKDAQNEDGTTTTLSDEEYNKVLTERGNEKLAECTAIKSFEGAIDPSTEHKYGSLEDIKMGKADYSIGDIVQVENEYGMGSRCRVTEFIRSVDSSGSETYPTFTLI